MKIKNVDVQKTAATQKKRDENELRVKLVQQRVRAHLLDPKNEVVSLDESVF